MTARVFQAPVRTTAALAVAAGLFAGCTGISTQTHAYIGSPRYAPTTPEHVQVLSSEPKQAKVRLGEIILNADGNPSRDALEERLKNDAAKLGADAVFVVDDRTRIFPVVWVGYWGPSGYSQYYTRGIVAVAIKYQ